MLLACYLWLICIQGQTSDSLAEDAYTCFVDRNIVGDLTGTWKVGVRQLHVNELDQFQDNTTLPLVIPDTWLTDKNFTTTYTFLPFVIVCSHTADGSVIVGYNAEVIHDLTCWNVSMSR